MVAISARFPPQQSVDYHGFRLTTPFYHHHAGISIFESILVNVRSIYFGFTRILLLFCEGNNTKTKAAVAVSRMPLQAHNKAHQRQALSSHTHDDPFAPPLRQSIYVCMYVPWSVSIKAEAIHPACEQQPATASHLCLVITVFPLHVVRHKRKGYIQGVDRW